MAHSIELLLDPDSDAMVRRMWAALLSDDLPSQGAHRSNSNRPHITLIAATRIDTGVDAEVRGLEDRFPLSVDVGATVVFRGRRSTVARLVVASRELLALHRDLHDLAAPFVDGGVVDHCTPDHWTPHLTVARRVPDDQLGRCIAVADDAGQGAAVTATVTGLRRWDGDAREDVVLIGV